MLATSISENLNGTLKWLFRYPRPCMVDSRIRNIRGAWEDDYGVPSSHTMLLQFVPVIHLTHYLYTDQSPFTLVMVPILFFLVGLTSFMRIYLGLHFLYDVAAAVLIAPLSALGCYA
ncbi:hypothetical protein BGZ67_001567 [Mortierella alpina]|nr:hypothetical protein BGZ67_001567 [Mortierella alpina]